MNSFCELVGAIVIFVLAIIGVGLLMSLPTMWLWNWLMPTIFGLTKITWTQALGLNILCGILFKSSNNKSKE